MLYYVILYYVICIYLFNGTYVIWTIGDRWCFFGEWWGAQWGFKLNSNSRKIKGYTVIYIYTQYIHNIYTIYIYIVTLVIRPDIRHGWKIPHNMVSTTHTHSTVTGMYIQAGVTRPHCLLVVVVSHFASKRSVFGVFNSSNPLKRTSSSLIASPSSSAPLNWP